jgi:hypothetical protein
MQQRQIVQALDEQIDIEYPIYTKYTTTNFDSISWMVISVIVTINRTGLLQKHEPNRYMMKTINLNELNLEL